MARILLQTRVKNGACINYVSLTVSSNGIGGSNCVAEIKKITNSMTFIKSPETHKNLPTKIMNANIDKLIIKENAKDNSIEFRLFSKSNFNAARSKLEQGASAYLGQRSTYYANLLKNLTVSNGKRANTKSST